MNKSVSLNIILEMLEIQKKNTILNSKNETFSSLQKKLQEIESDRQKVITGNEEVSQKIIEKYKLGVNKNEE